MDDSFKLQQLTSTDVALLRALNVLFGKAFADPETYVAEPPSEAYLEALLARDHVIALAAVRGREVVGGLVAYELAKFERARRELYIYDLAVAEEYRRRGIAASLIKGLCEIAACRDAWVVFVQADYGDEPAIALYDKFGIREEVLQFDIEIARKPSEPAP